MFTTTSMAMSGWDEKAFSIPLFKIGNGEDIRQSPSPGMFDLKAKAKRSAWQKETDAGTTAEQAQAKYVELVNGLKKSHGYDADKVPESVGA
ncbi:hypothetical protein BN1708_003061 [Verticillium longisporum]|uniref:ACB domain-containing protein n=1 Tax=Verticillium longisporum TaxID=100787 RepID=A0A0G4L718_VERLO|nr:hypothetical protein BN1708_003061 [Verticillium longisporum]